MKELDLNKGLAENILLFKVIGHWPFGNEKIYKVYTQIVMINMYLYNVAGLMNLWKNIDNTEEVTATVYNLLSTVAVIIKANILHRNFPHVKRIVETFKREEFQPRNEEQLKLLKSGIFLARFVFFYFFITADATVVMWLSFPIMDNQRRFPSNAWFPYDYLADPYYVPTYVWQSIFVCYHAMSNVAMDTLFAMLMVQTGAQCDALNEQINNLGKDNAEDSQGVLQDLHKCIIRHKLILELSNTIGVAFGNIVFVQFITSVLVLCETMFLLSLLQAVNATFVMLLFYQVAIFTQIFLYCWFGNEVIVKSEKLHYSVFCCNWCDCPQTFKKELLFFMAKLKTPITLFVGNVFPISVATFTGILRSSWAYFVALRKVHES